MTVAVTGWLGESIQRVEDAGILMSLNIYLRNHREPDKTSIREYLGGHLCRCTGYISIVNAALDAARRLQEMPGDA